MIQNRPTLRTAPSRMASTLPSDQLRSQRRERLIAEAELVFDDVAGIKRERQRDEDVQADDDAEQREQAEHRLLAGERFERGEPGVDARAEDEGHQARGR